MFAFEFPPEPDSFFDPFDNVGAEGSLHDIAAVNEHKLVARLGVRSNVPLKILKLYEAFFITSWANKCRWYYEYG